MARRKSINRRKSMARRNIGRSRRTKRTRTKRIKKRSNKKRTKRIRRINKKQDGGMMELSEGVEELIRVKEDQWVQKVDQLKDVEIQEKFTELRGLKTGSWNRKKDDQLEMIIFSLYSTVMAGVAAALERRGEVARHAKEGANIGRILKLFVKKEMGNTWLRGLAGEKDITKAVNDVVKILDFLKGKANNHTYSRLIESSGDMRKFSHMEAAQHEANDSSATAKIVHHVLELLYDWITEHKNSFLTMDYTSDYSKMFHDYPTFMRPE